METAHPWTVHKFGGSSLAGVGEFGRVAEILMQGSSAPRAAVVSASHGVTDRLIALLGAAGGGGSGVDEGLASLRAHHLALADGLLQDDRRGEVVDALDRDLTTIRAVLEATRLLGAVPVEAVGLVSGYGEVWAAQLLAGHLNGRGTPAHWLDAREFLVVAPAELGPMVDWTATRAGLERVLGDTNHEVIVVTGYIARTPAGGPTTLGRNGSDFSASILGSVLDAGSVVIWTNVDGVMSGDPRVEPEATVIPELSYSEAMEMAYFGATVIHPATMAPLVERGIPLFIRNTFRPELPGTRIAPTGSGEHRAKGITVIDEMALVNLQGAGLIGVPGTAARLFGTLREAGISVVVISQGSSEHSICVAVPEAHAAQAKEVLTAAFSLELTQGQVQGVEVQSGCAILAVVGDGMRGVPGVAGSLFGVLGRAGVNVRAIAQGASERNISAVIDGHDAARALRAVHAGFYLSPQTVSVGLVGAGSVGRELLAQMAAESERIRREANIDLRVRGIARSQTMLLGDPSIDLRTWRDDMDRGGEPADLGRFVAHVHANHLPHTVLVDCSASEAPAARYAEWLAAGIHVIAANKLAGTAPLDVFRTMVRARRAGNTRFLYETTVGAGLPILSTLRDLRQTGDHIVSVKGVLSGTLAYLFNVFDGTRPFSEIVAEARLLGYTEPDPRDDLSGMDVARKLVILGREMGLDLELSDVAVESLVPEALAGADVEGFLAGLAAHDPGMRARHREAAAAGEVLRYVGRVGADGRAHVGLERLPADHPFATIDLTDNVVQFVTDRYRDNPLIVRGPGAGPAVTAGGVFADLLRLSAYLGADV